ncbi:GNAT family N-acetyltransferase [Sinorhizobium medicae]|nr:GNAT family N-acetyltransferase [Sinorhizobium medicae]
MPAMTDPNEGLISFQQALDGGELQLHRCDIDKDLYVHVDQPKPKITRYTYTRLSPGDVSTGISIFVMVEPYEGLPCFQVGYAVPDKFRGQGKATDILTASIKELRAGLTRNGVDVPLYIEALIDRKNEASIHVAKKVLGPWVKETSDEMTGTPAFQFMLKVNP